MKNINSSINEFNEVWRKHLTLNKIIYIYIYFLYMGTFLLSYYIKFIKKNSS